MRYGFRMALAIGLLALTATAPAYAADAPAAEGVIQEAEDGRLTLKTDGGMTTVLISDDTKVHDGKAPLMKKVLRSGDVVVVQGTKESNGNIRATDIQLKVRKTD